MRDAAASGLGLAALLAGLVAVAGGTAPPADAGARQVPACGDVFVYLPYVYASRQGAGTGAPRPPRPPCDPATATATSTGAAGTGTAGTPTTPTGTPTLGPGTPGTPFATLTAIATGTRTVTPSATIPAERTATATAGTPDAGTPSPSPSASPSATEGPSPTSSASPSSSPSPAPSVTGTPPTATPTGEATATATGSPSATPSATMTSTGPPTLTSTPTSLPSPSLTPGPSPTPAETPRPGLPLGLQLFEADLQPVYDGLLDPAAPRSLRIRVLWSAVEPTDGGPYDWGMSDGMARTAARLGGEAMASLYRWPGWAASRSCGPVDRVPLARYEAFVRAAVERYDGDSVDDAPGSPRIAIWEAGNEPDFDPSIAQEGDYGSCFGDEPAAYAELLAATFRAARAADPGARVAFGGLAYDRFADRPGHEAPPGAPFRYHFLRDTVEAMYQARGQEPDFPFFDLIGFHNYSDFRNAWDGPDGSAPEIVGKVKDLRAAQLVSPGRWDLRGMPLLATEVGLASAPEDDWTERTEDYQAAYVGQVAARAMAAGLSTAVWYSAVDSSALDCQDRYAWLTFGLLRARWVYEAVQACETNWLPGYAPEDDWEPKPSLTAFAAARQALAGAAYERQLAPAETGDAAIEAHRMRLPGGDVLIVAYTDTGEWLGRRIAPPLARTLRVDAALVGQPFARLERTGYLGAQADLGPGPVDLPLTYRPVYLRAVAP